jgi:hypothetical protein
MTPEEQGQINTVSSGIDGIVIHDHPLHIMALCNLPKTAGPDLADIFEVTSLTCLKHQQKPLVHWG